MKKVVISGSSKLKDDINYWILYFKNLGFDVIDHPKIIDSDKIEKLLKDVYKNFYTSIENADILFLMNEKNKGIDGYIGANSMSELTYAVIQNLIHGKNIDIYILNMPSKEVFGYDEINFYLNMGWIKLFDRKKGLFE